MSQNQLWECPVEKHFWNGRLEIRDAKKKTVFYITLDTNEYWTVKKLHEQIVPKLVEFMNASESQASEEGLVPVASNGNGHAKPSQSERMKEYWRKRRESK